MEYLSPKEQPQLSDSVYSTGYNGWSHLGPGAALAIQYVRCRRSHKYAIILCRLTHFQYNESVHRKEQLATRINTIQYKNVNCIHVYFC